MKAGDFARWVDQGYNRIPVIREILADYDTPLSVYRKLADAPYSYLLESVQGGEKWGRYSIIGLPCRDIIRVRGTWVTLERDGQPVETIETTDPLTWIQAFQRCYRVPTTSEGLPRFIGGLVGYFGYDTIRYIEPRLARCPNPDPLNNPDILLLVSENVVVFDNLTGRMNLITLVDPTITNAYTEAVQRIDRWIARLREPRILYNTAPARRTQPIDFTSDYTQAAYEDVVRRIKDYINAGDCMQVVPSQRLSAPFEATPLDFYRALRGLNPSPYLYYLHLGDHHIVGSSPEILVRVDEGQLTVRPIAGTRRRGNTEADDRALEEELLADPKELAEHLMLIDLGRNDVGRVSEIGSVRLTDKMVIERYSHVMHIVSNVTGRLRTGLTAIDALRATFPAGTVSGAPKIRAMEIIDELEPVKRGVYAGAVGYLSWSGNMDTAIAIRTAVIKGGMLHVQAGGGVVADSIPHLEWEETMNKGRALIRAAQLAEQGVEKGHVA